MGCGGCRRRPLGENPSWESAKALLGQHSRLVVVLGATKWMEVLGVASRESLLAALVRAGVRRTA